MAKRRVVVTGATGVIATRILPALRERYELTLLDVKSTDPAGEEVAGVTVADLACRDRDTYRRHFEGADAVLHCAFRQSPGVGYDSPERYWLEAATPVEVSCWHLRSWVRFPVALLTVLLLAGCVVLATLRGRPGGNPWPRRGVALVGASLLAWSLAELGSSGALVPGALLGLAIAGYGRALHRSLWTSVRGVGAQLLRLVQPRPKRGSEEEEEVDEGVEPTGSSKRSPLGQLGLLGATAIVALFTMITLIRLLAVIV